MLLAVKSYSYVKPILIFAVMSGLWINGSPAFGDDTISVREITTIEAVANHEFDAVADRCLDDAQHGKKDSVDEEAEHQLVRAATLYATILAHAPQNLKSRDIYLSNIAMFAANAYIQAFRCNPSKWQYIDDAKVLIEERLHQIIEAEKRSQEEADYQLLAQKLASIQEKYPPTEGPSPQIENKVCPKCEQAPTHVEQRPYISAKTLERFSLRIEGGYIATDFVEKRTLEHYGGYVRIAPGLRFLLGKNYRHIVQTGLAYSFQTTIYNFDDWKSNPTHDTRVPGMSLSGFLGYGYRIHSRWASIHGTLDVGVVRYAVEEEESVPAGTTGQLGFALDACTWKDAVCLRFQPFIGNFSELWGIQLGAGFDILRFVENIEEKRHVKRKK